MFDGLISDDYYSRYGFERGARRYPDVTVKTPPARIVSDAQLIRYTRTDLLDGDDADTVARNLETISELQDFATAAQMHLDGPDGILDRCVAKQTLEASISTRSGIAGSIHLPYGPIIAVRSITYYNTVGAKITIPATDYILERGTFLRMFFNMGWPDPTLTVEYDAGYEVPPAPIVQAIKLLVGHYNEHRTAVSDLGNLQVLPLGVDSLIKPYRCFM